MMKLKNPQNLILFPLLLTILLACQGHQQSAVRASSGGAGPTPAPCGNCKPTNINAPIFNETQFKKGQWIEWQRKSNTGVTECLRWTFSDFPSSGIAIEIQTSPTCAEPDGYLVEHVLFNPASGAIISDVVTVNTTPPTASPGSFKGAIFDYLQGNGAKAAINLGSLKIGDSTYPVFQFSNKSIQYLNLPNTPFHAMALAWAASENNLDWKYQLNKSSPQVMPTATTAP